MSKKTFGILLLGLLLAIPTFAQADDVKYGNTYYDELKPFSQGLAAAEKDDDRWGFINQSGQEVIPFIYEEAESFSEGLAAVEKNDRWGFINQSGQEVIPFIYEEAESFSEGLAAVEKNDRWGFINQSGQEVIPCIYEEAERFSEGLAAVEKNDRWGYIDKNGQEIISFIYEEADPFVNGVARVERNDDQKETISNPLKQNTPAPAPATSTNSSIRVYLDGQQLSFDQEPIQQNGRTLVPLRTVFEALGATVSWDGATQTINATKGSKVIKMTIGSTTASINGRTIILDVPPINYNGRTMVPLRFVAESLDCDVDWDDDTRSIEIDSHDD